MSEALAEPAASGRPPRKRMRKRVRFGLLPALELAAFVLVLLFGGGAFVLSRLQEGPISLNWARDYVERALAADDSGDKVAIGDLQAVWVKERRAIQLLATSVDSLDASGASIARANRIALEFQLEQILAGRTPFSAFESDGGLFSVVFRASGKVDAGLGPPEAVMNRKSRPDPKRLEKMVEAIEGALKGEGRAGGLNNVSVQNARIILFDEKSRRFATASGAQVNMRRADGIVTGRFTTDLRSEGAPTAQVNLVFAGTSPGPFRARLKLVKFTPNAFLPPDIAPLLQSLAAPANAGVFMRFGKLGAIEDATVDASVEAGRLIVDGETRTLDGAVLKAQYVPTQDLLVFEKLEGTAAGARIQASGQISAPMVMFGRVSRYEASEFQVNAPVVVWTTPRDKMWAAAKTGEIRNLNVRGKIFRNADRIVVENFSANLDRGSLKLSGEAKRGTLGKTKEAYSIKARGAVTGPVSVDSVLTFWPPPVAKGAREWVGQSIKAGEITSATLDANISAAAIADKRVPDSALNLKFAFDQGAMIPYEGGFLIEGARGSARLGGDSFRLVGSGHSGSVIMDSANVDIARLYGENKAPLVVTATARGDVAGFARMFAQEMDPAMASRLGGEGTAKFSLTRPQRSVVPWDQMTMAGTGTFSGVRVDNVVGPLSLEGGKFDVTVDKNRLIAKGAARIGGQAANVTWQETIRPSPPGTMTTQISASGNPDASILDDFGFASRSSMRGAFGAEVFAAGERLRIMRGVVNLNLAQLEISPESLRWRKTKGTPGQFTLAFSKSAPDGPSAISINALTNGATMAFSGSLGNNYRLLSGDLTRFIIPGAFDITARMRQDASGRTLDVRGPLAEGRTVLGLIFSGGGEKPDPIPIEEGPLHIVAAVDQVYAGDQPTLKGVKFDGDVNDGTLNRGRLQAQTIANKAIAMSVAPDAGSADRQLRLDMEDLGAAARFVLVKGQVHGGSGVLDGRLYKEAGKETAQLRLRGKDFELRGTPALAKLLTFGSLRGLADTLNGDGIRFSSMEAPFRVQGSQMQIEDARASGPAMGITVKGGLNFDDQTMDVNGVLAPSYGVNSVLGKVPLVGGMFVSRKGEGVFGMTYAMQGPMEDARTRVNPLSVLTPGILRRVFEPGATVAEKATETPARN